MTKFPDEQPGYIIDSEQPTETARLIEQSKLFTTAMGGTFPRELDLSPIGDVLDLACGPGQWAQQVAFDSPQMEVVGIDIDAVTVRYASAFARSQGQPNISFEEMDITQPLEYADASFDLVNARFLAGFLTPVSWSALLAECVRILPPRGIVILSECEYGVSTSRALQQLGSLLTRALSQQGRTFSVDGHTMGIVHMLGKLLHDVGCVRIQQEPFLLDSSSGSALYAACFREYEVTYALLRPYLIRSGVVDETEFDRLYRQMLIEIQLEEFRALTFGVRAWGSKA